jgi:crotonobetainyl-CoA:carnitine CoA-transferase CaiB-like acyl-CoA transferase
MPDDPQVRALGIIEDLPHPIAKRHQIVQLPVTFDGAYARHQRSAPLLGQDTESVLASLGYEAEAVSTLLAAGVVAHSQQLPEGG